MNSFMTIHYYYKYCQFMEMFKLKIKLHHVCMDFRYEVIQSMWAFLLGMDGNCFAKGQLITPFTQIKKGKSSMIALM